MTSTSEHWRPLYCRNLRNVIVIYWPWAELSNKRCTCVNNRCIRSKTSGYNLDCGWVELGEDLLIWGRPRCFCEISCFAWPSSTRTCVQSTEPVCGTGLYNCLTSTCFLWTSHLHPIQPVHSQGYTLMFSTGCTDGWVGGQYVIEWGISTFLRVKFS